MKKEKEASLLRHKAKIQDALKSPVPAKHKGNERQYKAFLEKELSDVVATLEKEKV